MTAIEFVVLTPLLFFMIFATVQFGLYYFAQDIAQAAAQAGARKARAQADVDHSGWRGTAEATTSGYIRQLGPQLLEAPQVSAIQPSAHTVGVRVQAQVPSVFPGLDLSVHASSRGPVERFVPDGR